MLERPATRDDLAALVGLYERYDVAERGAVDTDEEDVVGDWDAPGVVMESDTLVLEDAGRVVGYAVVSGIGECDSVTDPDRRGEGMEDRLLAWLEERPGTLEHYMPNSDAEQERVFRQRGWQPARQFWRMWVDLDPLPPAPSWPEGVRVRAFHRETDARTVHELIGTAFAEIGGQHSRTFEEWSAFLLDVPSFDPELCLVVEEGGEVVGAAMSRDAVDYGFVRQLAVRKADRGRGIALATLRECFQRHAARGLPATALGVDAANPTGALTLYESAGMRVKEQFTRWELHRPTG